MLVGEALAATRAAGLHIVAVCPLVAGYLDKHHEFDDIVDPVADETEQFVREAIQPG
ncbi:MAG TPA: N-acetyltransferase [Mycobacterium sp.]|nr:N-acetyltransferase [Mycobacterium sp.]